MADTYAVNSSLEDQSHDYLFANRQFLYIPDSNSGSYSTQIVLEGSSISNSSRYFYAPESFITIPPVMTVVATA
jgi:hypothetical protein